LLLRSAEIKPLFFDLISLLIKLRVIFILLGLTCWGCVG